MLLPKPGILSISMSISEILDVRTEILDVRNPKLLEQVYSHLDPFW